MAADSRPFHIKIPLYIVLGCDPYGVPDSGPLQFQSKPFLTPSVSKKQGIQTSPFVVVAY